MSRYILNHQKWGVFVGECLGLGFWSQLDPVGQTEVVTFDDEAAANHALSVMYPQSAGAQVLKVDTDARYATEAECVAAGAKPWVKR